MTYVITQSCCNDASCVAECPVDCIRPTPDDPVAFAAAEMLYIDPDSCIDCGACQEACPVGAVYPEDDLPDHLQRFTDFNAGYFLHSPLEATQVGAPRPERPAAEHGPLKVAIIGSGPSAAYLADDLLQRGNVQIDMLDRLPTPWGLLRSGVAPDHLETKNLHQIFDRPFTSSAFSYYLNVELGRDVALAELQDRYHAVVLATGASEPTAWTVPGADLLGVTSAPAFVGWYNGHPDHADANIDLTGERAVIVGNGNVALDVARVLSLDVDALQQSDIADHALDALATSNIREIVILARRGPLQAAFTPAEFLGLLQLRNVDVAIDDAGAILGLLDGDETDATMTYSSKLKRDLTREAAERPTTNARRRIVFKYFSDPVEVVGDGSATAVAIQRTTLVDRDGSQRIEATDDPVEALAASLVITATGYRSRPIQGVPYDQTRGVVRNIDGAVVDDDGAACRGVYVTGWAKRGARGGIGSGRIDASDTAAKIVSAFNLGELAPKNESAETLAVLLEDRGVAAIDLQGWRSLDAHELSTGNAVGRPRLKLTDVSAMTRVANATRT